MKKIVKIQKIYYNKLLPALVLSPPYPNSRPLQGFYFWEAKKYFQNCQFFSCKVKGKYIMINVNCLTSIQLKVFWSAGLSVRLVNFLVR